MNGEEWKQYWQGRHGIGEASLRAKPAVEMDQIYQRFWKSRIGDEPRNARLIDLACGAGSVISHAHWLGFTDLTGVDISEAAISILKSRYPEATGIIASAEDTPVPDGGFDLVLSQFGFEYAGVDRMLPVIARLLAPTGRFIAVAHRVEGAVYRECERSANDCLALEETGFVLAAKRVFEAQFATDKSPGDTSVRAELESAVSALTGPRDKLQSLARNGHALAGQLLSGTQQMFQRRGNYLAEDITGWLTRVSDENKAHQARMTSMLSAALTELQVTEALRKLSRLGLVTRPPEILFQESSEESVAWILEGYLPTG